MDDAPFELVDKDGGCLTVRCTGCGEVHELPPLEGEPVHLECPCGHEAEFMLASPGAELAADGDGDEDERWSPSWN